MPVHALYVCAGGVGCFGAGDGRGIACQAQPPHTPHPTAMHWGTSLPNRHQSLAVAAAAPAVYTDCTVVQSTCTVMQSCSTGGREAVLTDMTAYICQPGGIQKGQHDAHRPSLDSVHARCSCCHCHDNHCRGHYPTATLLLRP